MSAQLGTNPSPCAQIRNWLKNKRKRNFRTNLENLDLLIANKSEHFIYPNIKVEYPAISIY